MMRTQLVSVEKSKKSQLMSSKDNKSKQKKINNGNRIRSTKVNDKNIGSGVNSSINIQEQAYNKNVKEQSLDTYTNELNKYSVPKLERANTFFLTRKLSKLYDTLTTNSKENLNEEDTSNKSCKREPKKPFKFIRSVSLAAITLRKDYRNSIRKPQLEQLSEEDNNNFGSVIQQNNKTNPNKDEQKLLSTASIESLSSRTSEKSFNLMSAFKRTFSLTPARRKKSTKNHKWSASLMNLQQIDVMISYEDLSFIDYDKFNTYEEHLKRTFSQNDVNNKIHMQRSSIENNENYCDAENVDFKNFGDTKIRARKKNQMSFKRRHSTIYSPVNQVNEENQSTINWLNDRCKRWSNPCVGDHALNVDNRNWFTSYASIVKLRPKINQIDSDTVVNKSTPCIRIKTKTKLKEKIHSMDDVRLNNLGNDITLLQTVSAALYLKRLLSAYTLFLHTYFHIYPHVISHIAIYLFNKLSLFQCNFENAKKKFLI